MLTLPKAGRYVAHLNRPELMQVTPEAQPLLVEWWNVSRLSRHRSNATWTELAWKLSVNRVARLPAWKQVALAQAGIEYGWQTLKPEYLKNVSPPPEAGVIPKSTAMQEAIEAWNNRVA